MALANPQQPVSQPAAQQPETEEQSSPPTFVTRPADGGKMVVSTCKLHDTHLKMTFEPDLPVEVPRITKWMQAQIDAKLLRVL